MSTIEYNLRSRRLITMIFACLSGISAIATAVMPAIA
jgi:hypothetical protein